MCKHNIIYTSRVYKLNEYIYKSLFVDEVTNLFKLTLSIQTLIWIKNWQIAYKKPTTHSNIINELSRNNTDYTRVMYDSWQIYSVRLQWFFPCKLRLVYNFIRGITLFQTAIYKKLFPSQLIDSNVIKIFQINFNHSLNFRNIFTEINIFVCITN